MKIKLNKLFYWSIFLQIISTQGILLFILFNFFGFWEYKKVIHPIAFLLAVVCFITKSIKKIKITVIDISLLCYFLIQSFLLIFNVNGIESFFLSFREVFLLYILIFIYQQFELDSHDWRRLLRIIFYLLIINTFFIVLTYLLGPEQYMKLLTGRYYWYVDPEYKFQMSNFNVFWRSPALVGNAPSVAYFSMIAYILMDIENHYFKKKKYIVLIPLIFSFIRSAYIVLIVYEFFKFFSKKKNLKKLILISKVGIPLLVLFILYLNKYKLFSLESLEARFGFWRNNIDVPYNLFYGGAIGQVGGAVRGSGFMETLDSYWLNVLMTTGTIGLLILVVFILEKGKKSNKFIFAMLGFVFAGFFINLTQSIVFLVMFPLLFLRIKEENLKKIDNVK